MTRRTPLPRCAFAAVPTAASGLAQRTWVVALADHPASKGAGLASARAAASAGERTVIRAAAASGDTAGLPPRGAPSHSGGAVAWRALLPSLPASTILR
ncbi:MAG: hypothetical protein IPM29_23900 [Planctomycetes bacterium]|nr:hypothetical protein [Planctomycetota bacterium]